MSKESSLRWVGSQHFCVRSFIQRMLTRACCKSTVMMNKHSGKDRAEMNEFLLLFGLGTHLQVFSASRPGTTERGW